MLFRPRFSIVLVAGFILLDAIVDATGFWGIIPCAVAFVFLLHFDDAQRASLEEDTDA